MDSSTSPWLPETELENLNFKDDDGEFNLMDYFDEELVAFMGEGCECDVSPKNINNSSTLSSSLINTESANPISLSSFNPSSSSSAPVLLNFGNPNSPIELQQAEEQKRHKKNMKKATARTTPDHILAERRRRQQLSRYFLALSTIVPGIKKMDKTSIMGDTITHLKYLQERVKSLEEEARNKSIQSVVLVKNRNSTGFKTLVEIEARLCDAQILINIECEYTKGLLAKLIAHLEKLNLNIITAHALRFGTLALEITIITKMEKEFNSSVNQVLKSLHAEITHHSPICSL